MEKIPFSLILPDSTLQEQLNERLKQNQKPFIYGSICIAAALFIIGMNLMVFTDVKFDGKFVILLTLTMCIFVLLLPKHSTKIILSFRLLICILIVKAHIQLFEGKDFCYGSIDFFKKLFVKRQFTVDIYIVMVFITPFQDKYFFSWMMTTVIFAVEYYMVNKY